MIHPAAPASVPSPATPASAPTNLAPPRQTRSHAFISRSRGHWSGAITGYAYRWFVGGRVKTNATGNRLRLTGALRGCVLKCTVTATSPTGRPATATSAGVRG